ncbi:ABC transporter permease [Scopulibacillus cellulosilyticus]|uniref:ABC transporter permease n=1 Tax=Scopulibacillus cellulosilyticus TaxID=2665665 RepID=A0ABW2PSI2_9BACL
MLRLIQNENMKIYRKSSNRIMLLMLIGLIIAAGLIIKFNTPSPKQHANDHWKQSLIKENKNLEKEIKKVPKESQSYLKKEIATNQYRIDHNLPPVQGFNIWSFVDKMAYLVMVIAIFTIILAGGSVASEFNWGTIKLLLIRPVSRTSVLFSKYIATLLYAILMLVILFIVSWLIGGILFGFSGLTEPHLQYHNGHVTETNMVLYIFKEYGLNCVQLIMYVTLAAMISSVFRNSALAIGLSIFLLMVGPTAVQFLSKYDWVKYILFANTDLTQYITGTPIVSSMTLGFSLAVLAVYYIAFILIGWLFYTKRDVAA